MTLEELQTIRHRESYLALQVRLYRASIAEREELAATPVFVGGLTMGDPNGGCIAFDRPQTPDEWLTRWRAFEAEEYGRRVDDAAAAAAANSSPAVAKE